MKTRKFLMVLVVLFMGSQVALFAQDKKGAKSERRQFNREQMQEMQANQIIKGLALDDATATKFIPVYKSYMEEMRATRSTMNARQPDGKQNLTDKKAPKPIPTDAEVEQSIKARFAQSRKMLDIREKYYNEFRKFLTPKQIQKMYNMEKRNGEKFRKEMNKRQGMRKQHVGKQRGMGQQGGNMGQPGGSMGQRGM